VTVSPAAVPGASPAVAPGAAAVAPAPAPTSSTAESPCLRLDLAAPDVSGAVAMTALLADPTRAAVLAMLRDGPHCVCEMSAALGERQNNLSNHLARLRDAGLIHRTLLEADARRVYYERDEAACAAALTVVAAVLGRSS
jgi:ArsR family transcriptional regulator, arsenate/arsenite/antimonite-responsive transcriptional repressor